MRKLLKGFLIGAGVLVALAAVAIIAINLYVQSAGTQKRIEHALSSGLKVPVHVTSTIVTPWGGLKASGITVPQPSPHPDNFLEADNFTAHFDWVALMKHRLDASDVSLNNPRVSWFQSPDGKWELPRPAAAPAPSATPAVAQSSEPHKQPWSVNVGKLKVSGASFDFWDEKGNRAGEFAGVDFDCANPNAAAAEGTAACANVSLHDKLFFRQMHTDWSYGKGTVKLTSFQTTIGGGAISGDAQLATRMKHSPFNADVKFDGVNVNELMIEAGQEAGQVTGTLRGWIDLNGNSGKTSSINGSGHLQLSGGKMQDIEILQLLGQGLQIPDLVELNLKDAEVDARVVSGVINVDKLILESQNLEVSGTGTIGTDGKLAMNARLSVNGTITQRLPSFILTYFQPGATDDSKYIDFKVNNTLQHPKTNLLENILGHRIESQMGDLIKSIFSKKHGAPKAEPENAPPP